MDFSSISNTPVASAPGAVAGPMAAGDTPAGSAPGSPGGSAFGGVLQSLLPPQERQELAAPEAADLALTPGLTAHTLGLNLQIITPATPVPGEGSLADFARQQGLNEAAIQALFGSAVPLTGELAAGPQGDRADTALLTDATTVLPLADARALWAFGTSPVPVPALTPAPLTGGGLTPEPTATLPGPLAQVLGTTGLTRAWGADPLLTSAQNVPFSIQNLLLGEAEAPPAPTPEEALELSLKLSVQPSSLTTRLMNLQGTQVTQPWSQLMTTVQTANSQALQELTLEIGPEAMQALNARELELEANPDQAADEALQPTALAAGTEASAKTAPTTASSGTANNPNQPGQQFRADQIQQLADKMGQALAERLQQQIAKGEWSLQLRMNPAKLGQVDVTLDMTAAGLEAVFQSDNALTRELITLGSHRLKESLTQSGMNLANVFVNSDGDRQAGGNPTQQQKQARASKPDVQDSPRAATAVAPSRIMRPDGWDVLA